MYSIYNLYKKDSNDNYIGKTKNINKRMALHKFYSKSSPYKLYEFMRLNGGFENFEFEILEDNIPEEQGVYKERYYYDMYTPNLNTNLPGRNQHDSKLYYRTKNRLEIIEKVRNWQRKNKERFNKYQREYKQNKKKLLSTQINNGIQEIY